ncbi:aldehyde dehydrogenase [Reichenbachiella carrageenanivorans]|uniref:Aldehyde dehydrogenase n=1 Tax=Reichenbachiella carrageenanivorans TaxID=2979869 RepID=A0ABY6D253_9BACT|nr:aldehyde dehydrogenase [Reichenbachiella carrageenanivorans]UXX79695.1 aldehyde dehydrogenase [Reichenbachiella carrageenanivorans]
MQKIDNYIDGELVAPIDDAYLDNVNPATGQVYALTPDSDQKDVQRAVDAAKAAFSAWSSCGIETRARLLDKIADLIDENIDILARAESIDNGKPLSLARNVDIPRASANFRFYASGIQHFASESHYMEGLAINYTQRTPIGVAGCISPWNLPLYLFSWKIAPALAAGNTVVAKPTEVAPMTAYLLSKICIDAGLPKGVLNIVHGFGHKVGQAIVAHEDIPVISFTGGTETGKKIATTAAPMFKKMSLELGGKNPNIIFADCDFDEMLKTTLRSSFANQGQICLCGSRIFVERPIYEKFKMAFVSKVQKMKVGDPLDEQTRMGAVVSETHMNKVLGYIQLAQQEGGTVLAGGQRVIVDGDCAEGYFIAPTVIEGLHANCRTNQEEIFGPVVTMMPFDTEDEVLQMANATPYGLAATVWTQDLKRAHKFSHQLKSAIVWVNCWLLRDLRTPFGGMKQSGMGREGGFEALRFFTEPQNICIKL